MNEAEIFVGKLEKIETFFTNRYQLLKLSKEERTEHDQVIEDLQKEAIESLESIDQTWKIIADI